MAQKRKRKLQKVNKESQNTNPKDALSKLDKSKLYSVIVEDLTDDGDGIGRIDGLTVFIHNALPGDHIMCRLIKVKKNYAIGIIEQMMERSKDHIDAACPHARLCGGCQLQEYRYDAQVQHKSNMLNETLKRIGGLTDYEYDGFIGMDEPSHYRNKGIYQCAPHPHGTAIGFYRKRSHDLVDIKTCMLQTEATNDLMHKLRGIIEKSGIPAYSEVTREGLLRRIMVRDVTGDASAMMLVIVVKGHDTSVDRLVENIINELPINLKSIYLNINADPGNTALSYDYEHVFGDETIIDAIGKARFIISPQSFFQINHVQTEALYGVVKKYVKAIMANNETIAKERGLTVLDLYCGIGSIGQYLAKEIPEIKRILGVEIVENAILDARKNADFNSLENTSYYVGKAEDIMPELKEEGKEADIVILDPPRKGCDEGLLQTLVEMGTANIVYVSCKPSTLARDLKFLSANGYQVTHVTGVDMFPWTGHVETVSKLKKLR